MKNPLSLFLALMLSMVLTVPVFADIQYADKDGNYTVVTDATLNGGLEYNVYGNVAAVWENRSSTEQRNENSQAWHIVKADSSGYHNISDWYQEIGGFCKSGFAAAQNFDGKWGVLNAEGQVVVDFKFDEMNNPTDDGYVLATLKDDGTQYIVLNLKTGKEAFRNSYESTDTGQTTQTQWEDTWVEPLDGYNNGLIPVQVTKSVYHYDAATQTAHSTNNDHTTYCQYFGLDGKPAFPTKFDGYNSISAFQNGYALVTERVNSPNYANDRISNVYSSIIDTSGNIILADNGKSRIDGWKDEWRTGWRPGDFVLTPYVVTNWNRLNYSMGVVSEESIVRAALPSEVQGKAERVCYLDLNGQKIAALEEYGGRPFRNGYAVSGSYLIDANGNEVFHLTHSYPTLSNVSNTGFCWVVEEGGQGKDDGSGSKDRILGVIQVPVKASSAPVSSAPAASNETAFSDVPADAYYADAVKWAVDKGVTKGVSETNFAPAETCTRGQVATFLWRAKGCPEPQTTENPFEDVDPSSAFYKAILWAAESGITTGTSDTTFSPGNPCTRAHVVTFLWRSQGKPAASGAAPLADSLPQGYYTDAVRWADSAGLLNGMGEAFAPSALCPRADIVTYLYRVLT